MLCSRISVKKKKSKNFEKVFKKIKNRLILILLFCENSNIVILFRERKFKISSFIYQQAFTLKQKI